MFSIVIPVRDKPLHIGSTLQSVFAQSFSEFELILVGAPGDASMAIAAEFADPRLKLIWCPNAGQGDARNAGVRSSRHDWIAFLDADDLWLPGHLAELEAVRRAHPDAGLIGTRYIDSDLAGRYALPPHGPAEIEKVCLFTEIGAGLPLLCTSSAAVPREVFGRLGGFGSSHFGEDSELWARIALEHEVAVSRRATAVYRHGTGGITESGRDRWSVLPLASPVEISPAVALLTAREPEEGWADRGPAIESCIRRHFHWAMTGSIAVGDVGAVRRMRTLYRGRPRGLHAGLFALARLPPPVARLACRTLLRLSRQAAGWREVSAAPSGRNGSSAAACGC